MTSVARSVLVLGCLFAAVAACAQDTGSWGTSRYVRLGADRVVVFSHGSTFDLQRDAAWDIPDADQKKRFQAWVKTAGLPKDPGQFVADLPTSRETPLAGEIRVGPPSGSGATLQLVLGQGQPSAIALEKTSHWSVATKDRDTFEAFASKLKTTLPTLLVALSAADKPTEPAAWQRLIERSASTGGFVTLLGGSKQALWTHRVVGLAAPVTPAVPKDKPATASQEPSGAPPAWLIPAIAGGAVVVLGAGLFAVPAVRTRVLGAGGNAAPAGFPVGSHERELILKVREEGRRKPPNSIHSEEEYAVGLMLDRYREHDTLTRELENARKQAEALQAYKEYQQQYEQYEKRYLALSEEMKKRDGELAKQQKSRKELQEKLSQAETYLKELQNERAELLQALTEADVMLRETGDWCKAVTDRLNAQAAKIHNE